MFKVEHALGGLGGHVYRKDGLEGGLCVLCCISSAQKVFVIFKSFVE